MCPASRTWEVASIAARLADEDRKTDTEVVKEMLDGRAVMVRFGIAADVVATFDDMIDRIAKHGRPPPRPHAELIKIVREITAEVDRHRPHAHE